MGDFPNSTHPEKKAQSATSIIQWQDDEGRMDSAVVYDELNLPEFSEYIMAMVGDVAHMQDEASGASLTISDITLEMPFELELDQSAGLSLRGSPPTQRTETSNLPVLHHLKVRFEADVSALGSED